MLPFSQPEYDKRRREQGIRISISGVQSKHSLKLTGSTLELTEDGGEYILKSAMRGAFEHMTDTPANEHITMQLARRVFGLPTAENALVFFRDDNAPAYLTKRFDVRPDSTRVPQEDMAQVAGLSEATGGKNYKYDFSYEGIAALLKRHVSAYAVEVEKYFKLVLFNYLGHNGDAHTKNFSLFRDPELHTYLMAPAYDLLNTRLHLPAEPALALDLFEGDYETPSYKVNGYFARDDFLEFGRRLGIPPNRVTRFINELAGREGAMAALMDQSFLSDPLKSQYKEMVKDRIRALNYSYLASTA
jgi:serine/threonine-protein kinase HipA